MSYQKASPPEAKARWRHQFTRKRIEQISTQIAIIGVTVGTLQVTCSRRGISLRRPRVKLLPPKRANGTETTVGGARFTIDMKYKGQEHSTELPFTPEVIGQLALEASFRDQEIGELAKDILVSVLEKELVPKLLDE